MEETRMLVGRIVKSIEQTDRDEVTITFTDDSTIVFAAEAIYTSHCNEYDHSTLWIDGHDKDGNILFDIDTTERFIKFCRR